MEAIRKNDEKWNLKRLVNYYPLPEHLDDNHYWEAISNIAYSAACPSVWDLYVSAVSGHFRGY